jgi:hypothetical protein
MAGASLAVPLALGAGCGAVVEPAALDLAPFVRRGAADLNWRLPPSRARGTRSRRPTRRNRAPAGRSDKR